MLGENAATHHNSNGIGGIWTGCFITSFFSGLNRYILDTFVAIIVGIWSKTIG